jgi:hypothetical protein
MRKATCPLGSVDSSNPCCRRGKQLHHHGGDVCCVFVLCVGVSSGCLTCRTCKKDQNTTLRYAYCLTIRLVGVTVWSTHTCTMPTCSKQWPPFSTKSQKSKISSSSTYNVDYLFSIIPMFTQYNLRIVLTMTRAFC